MERFIVKYSNGKIRQQPGINMTFHYMVGIGVIDFIIDTKEGEVYFRTNKEDEFVECTKISSYSASDMVSNFKSHNQ